MGLFGVKVEAKQPETTEEENFVASLQEGGGGGGNTGSNSAPAAASWSSWFQSRPSSTTPADQFVSQKTESQFLEGGDSGDGNRKEASSEDQPDSSTSKAMNNEEGWGYDLYPERKGETYKPRWSRVLFGLEGTENLDKAKCERNVYWCVKNSPLVKLMMGAMKSSGCPVDIRRHISCEVCDPTVTGGYDPVLNQIVVCQNMARRKGFVQGVLTHEMIHMFDYCNNELDFRNIDHLACTEIRAANLAHCSFLSACAQGDASVINIRKTHEVHSDFKNAPNLVGFSSNSNEIDYAFTLF